MSGYHLYSTDGKTVASLTAALGLSKAYVGLVTRNFVKDAVQKDTEVAKQVKIAREMSLPAVLLFFDNLTVEDRETAKKLFEGMYVVKTFEAPHEPYAFKTWLVKNMDILHKALKDAAGQ